MVRDDEQFYGTPKLAVRKRIYRISGSVTDRLRFGGTAAKGFEIKPERFPVTSQSLAQLGLGQIGGLAIGQFVQPVPAEKLDGIDRVGQPQFLRKGAMDFQRKRGIIHRIAVQHPDARTTGSVLPVKNHRSNHFPGGKGVPGKIPVYVSRLCGAAGQCDGA
jgi:hypothetical protein